MNVKAIVWGVHGEPNDKIRYDHVVGVTPIGEYLITWKSWKEYPTFTIDAHPFNSDFCPCEMYLHKAKDECQKHFDRMIRCCVIQEI